LFVAATHGHLEVVKILLEAEANPNRKSKPFEQTPLLTAVINGRMGVVELLLGNLEVEVNSAGSGKNETPLHLAVQKSQEDVIACFLDDGRVDVNVQSSSNRTPLHLAARRGISGIVKLLLNHHRTDVNLTDNKGETPLHSAIRRNHTAVVEML
ncbi:ankyrin repeat domain-containing protein, partial [Aspergillus homomorphus CBS 101889]